MGLRDILYDIASMFLSLLSIVSFVITAAGFVAATPLFVVFSPVLVPMGVTTGLLVTGLAASGGIAGSNVTSVTIILKIIMKLYKLATGKEPPAMLKRAADRASAAAAGGVPAPGGGASPAGGASGGSTPPAGGASPPAGKPSWW